MFAHVFGDESLKIDLHEHTISIIKFFAKIECKLGSMIEMMVHRRPS
jgi:hypothetical protein